MAGAKFAKKGKNINLIHQASQLKRKAVIKRKTNNKVIKKSFSE
jgi:hypothetical protein